VRTLLQRLRGAGRARRALLPARGHLSREDAPRYRPKALGTKPRLPVATERAKGARGEAPAARGGRARQRR
jgi:hypothetical protein